MSRYNRSVKAISAEFVGVASIPQYLADKITKDRPLTTAEDAEIAKAIVDATNILRERHKAHPRSHSTTQAESLVREPRHRMSTSVRHNGLVIN